MKYKQYQKYKDSGIEWIREIPEHWEIRKLKYSVDLYSKKSNGNAKERPYVGLENIESKTGRLIPDFPTEFEGDSKEFESGDVLFGKLRPYLAKAILADFSGRCSGEILVLRGNKIKPELLHHLVLSDGFIQIVNSSTYGAKMPRAEWPMIGNILVPISPEKEQNEIYDFLKKETSNFNDLISKSQSQVNFLQEKRQALINHAVTKGLDPTVPLKDSGIEWIGEIPEHWEVNKIKFTSYVKGRIGWQGLTTREYIDEGPYLITGTDFQDGKINWKTCHHVEQWRYEQDPYIQIKNNDILITKDGTIGKIAIVDDLPGDTTLNSGVMVVRPLNNHFIPKYLNWILNSSLFTDFINYIKSGTTINHLYQEEFGKFVFPIPEQEEQNQISDYLDKQTTQFDDLISKSQSQIKLLQEKRQALITAAVTGKIDVRNGVAA